MNKVCNIALSFILAFILSSSIFFNAIIVKVDAQRTQSPIFSNTNKASQHLTVAEEGGASSNATISAERQRTFATSQTPLPFSDLQLNKLRNATEQTLNRPQIGITNGTAYPTSRKCVRDKR